MATVSVPQQDGEIRISLAGDTPLVYPVKGGKADVPDDQLNAFLANVDGASVKAAKATTSNTPA